MPISFNSMQIPPQSIPGYQGNSQYGNPFGGGRMPMGVGSLLMMMMGNKMMPLVNPAGDQSLYDAVWSRQHSMDMMSLARKTVTQSFPFQNLGGMNPNSFPTQIVASLMSDPNGMAAKLMSPLLGGNPIAAQMSTYANLQGLGASALGNTRGVSMSQVSNRLDEFNKFFYKHDEPRDPRETFEKEMGEANLSSDKARKFRTQLIDEQRSGSGGMSLLEKINKSGMNESDKKAMADAVEKGVSKQTLTLQDAIKNGDKNINHEANSAALLASKVRGMDYSRNLGFSSNSLLGFTDQLIKDHRISIPFQATGALAAGGDDARTIPMLMASARSVFGNQMSDKALGQAVNAFIGSSPIDSTDPNSLHKVEEAFRTTKAVARDSNIDISTLMNFQSQGQTMAAQNPLLKMLGGLDINKVLTSQVEEMGTMISDTSNRAGNDWFLATQGGPAGRLRNKFQGTLNAMSDPSAAMIAGTRTYIDASYNGADKATKLKAFDKWAQGNDRHDNTMGGYYGMLQDAGIDVRLATQYSANNPYATALGYASAQAAGVDLADVGKRMQVDNLRRSILIHGGQGNVNSFNKFLKNNDMAGLLKNRDLNLVQQDKAWIQALADSGALDEESIRLDDGPGGRKEKGEKNKKLREMNQELEKQTDLKLGSVRSDVMTKVMQTLMSGDLNKQGIAAALNPLTGGAAGGQITDMVNAATKLNKLQGADNLKDIVGAVGGTEDQAKGLKNMQDLANKWGIDPGDLKAIISTDKTDTGAFKKLVSKHPNNLTSDDIDKIKTAAIATQSIGDFSKAGSFSDASVKDMLGKSMQKTLGDAAWSRSGIGESIEQYDKAAIGNIQTSAFATPESKQLGEALLKVSQTNDAFGNPVLDKTGKPKEDFTRGITDVNDFLNSSTEDPYSKNKAAQKLVSELGDKLPENIKKEFAQTDTGEGAMAGMKDLRKWFGDDNNVKQILGANAAAVEKHKEITGEKEGGVGTGDLPAMVQQILVSLKGLSGISEAINGLTHAVNGDPTKG